MSDLIYAVISLIIGVPILMMLMAFADGFNNKPFKENLKDIARFKFNEEDDN